MISFVIATPLPQLPVELVRVMAQACLTGSVEGTGQTFLPFNLYLPENI